MKHSALSGMLAVSAFAALVAAVPLPQMHDDGRNRLTDDEKKAGWTLLFDGTTVKGWRGYKQPDAAASRWKVVDGMLTTVVRADGKDTHGARDIVSTNTYDSFELTWEWKIAEGGNSGLKYFVLEDQDAAIGHEYQLIDDERHPDAKVGPKRQTAALYDVLAAANRPTRPAGQFNQSRVFVRGPHVEHWLNGRKVLEYELASPELKKAIAESKFKDVARFGTSLKGHILLQDHGDEVWYRSIKIRPIKAT